MDRRRGDLALVRLPAEAFENGKRITVEAKALRSAADFQKVGA